MNAKEEIIKVFCGSQVGHLAMKNHLVINSPNFLRFSFSSPFATYSWNKRFFFCPKDPIVLYHKVMIN